MMTEKNDIKEQSINARPKISIGDYVTHCYNKGHKGVVKDVRGRKALVDLNDYGELWYAFDELAVVRGVDEVVVIHADNALGEQLAKALEAVKLAQEQIATLSASVAAYSAKVDSLTAQLDKVTLSPAGERPPVEIDTLIDDPVSGERFDDALALRRSSGWSILDITTVGMMPANPRAKEAQVKRIATIERVNTPPPSSNYFNNAMRAGLPVRDVIASANADIENVMRDTLMRLREERAGVVVPTSIRWGV